jgi:hypothetical protein
VLSIAIIARRSVTLPRLKVAATTTSAIAGSLLLITSILVFAARDARLHVREAIVIAQSARLLDTRHLAIEGASALPEGVRVRVLEEGGGFSRIVVGGTEGYLPSSAVLPLTKR